MIVCVCYRVNDRKINELINEGFTAREVLQTLGIGDCCGKCVPVVREMAREAKVVRYVPLSA